MGKVGFQSLPLLESQCEHSVTSKWFNISRSQLQGLKEAFNCPNDCNGRGRCNGRYECGCESGFTGYDCVGKDNLYVFQAGQIGT